MGVDALLEVEGLVSLALQEGETWTVEGKLLPAACAQNGLRMCGIVLRAREGNDGGVAEPLYRGLNPVPDGVRLSPRA